MAYSIHSVEYEQLEDGTWIAYRDGDFPNRTGDDSGCDVTGRGKTQEAAEIDLLDRVMLLQDEFQF